MSKTVIGLLFALVSGSSAFAQTYSDLWGVDGEKWRPGSPLKDFSNVAGYRGGLVPLPRREVKVNIKDFGGKGDGIADDTQALIAAIKACPTGGAIFIPNGKYKITDWIRIKNLKQITIRGEDMFETQLVFPKGLEDIHPSSTTTTGGIATSSYSWSGGFFWFDNAEELGIENLSFMFKDTPYRDHFDLDGSNMMVLNGKNNWVKNVRGRNADNGIFSWASYTTFSNILMEAYPGRPVKSGRAGHHAIDLQGGTHTLVENYEETVKFIHSLGSEGAASWNVWSQAKGTDIEIDHHNAGSGISNNLFTDIDMGKGQGAEGQRNADTGGDRETYWNLRSTQILPFDPSGGGIRKGIPVFKDQNKYIVVGWWLDWPDSEKSKRSASLPWYEHIGNYKDIEPKNIYIAQVKKRLNTDNLAPDTEITTPYNGQRIDGTKAIKATVMSVDRDGSVTKVTLELDGVSLGSRTQASYQWYLPALRDGAHSLKAITQDNKGKTSSDTVTFNSAGNAGGGTGNTGGGGGGNGNGNASLTSGKTYTIKTINDKCLDVNGNSTANDANIQQYDCHSKNNQRFEAKNVVGDWYQLIAKNSGKCLNIAGNSTTDSAAAIQWTCGDYQNEHFKVVPVTNGVVNIVARHSGKCLDVPGGSENNGTNLQQYRCNGGTNQLFLFE